MLEILIGSRKCDYADFHIFTERFSKEETTAPRMDIRGDYVDAVNIEVLATEPLS